MIEQLEGVLTRADGASHYVKLGPLMLEILVPTPVEAAPAIPGQVVTLYTHLQWKEDGPVLFGFESADERRLFRLLLSVQGVGPRIALAILAHLPPARLIDRLRAEDDAVFTTVPGVGKKTASRILVELGPQAEKLALTMSGLQSVVPAPGRPPMLVSEDARQALTALGYPPRDAERALMKVQEGNPQAPLEELIRLALRELTQSASAGKR